MTPALKAMVEAMAAEIVRQKSAKELIPMHSAEPSRILDPGAARDGELTSIYLMGRFDLEKVARAGLEAITPADRSITMALHNAAKLKSDLHEAYQDIWAAGVAAILKDQP